MAQMKEENFLKMNCYKLLSYSSAQKKHILHKICSQLSSLNGKDKNKIENYLSRIMRWRNAFAHGQLKIDDKKGVILDYYSDAPKTEFLDDEFWNTVESIFQRCDEIIKNLKQMIQRKPGLK